MAKIDNLDLKILSELSNDASVSVLKEFLNQDYLSLPFKSPAS